MGNTLIRQQDQLPEVHSELGDMGKNGNASAPHPWFELVQWACEDATASQVFQWNYSDIKTDIQCLAGDAETFKVRCPCVGENDPPGFSFDDSSTFVCWAELLLEQDPVLQATRFNLVPKKLTEEAFWRRYFAAVRNTVLVHIQGSH